MAQCNEIRAQIGFYLDDELQGAERDSFEAHLTGCDNCRQVFDSESRFLSAIRDSAPLHTASDKLRANVQQLLSESTSSYSPSPELLKRITEPKGNKLGILWSGRGVQAAAAILGIASMIGIWLVLGSQDRRPNPPSDFAMMAVDTHQRHLRNQLPLEIVSDVPDQISAWFVGKVPFRVELPNYQESSGQEKLYSLEGARLVGYNNDYAAYVAYQMRMQPISLVVTSESVVRPSGGEEIASRGLTFHYDTIQGLKVITWADRGLTYALVSDLEERGQQSCIVCHQGTRDQDFVESLKPKGVAMRLF